MSSFPVDIKKIKVENFNRREESEIKESVKYLFIINEKGNQWQQTFICDRDELLKFRQEIDSLIAETTTAEVLELSFENAKKVDEHYKTDELCQGCKYKLSFRCKACLFVLQSPLERMLYLQLLDAKIQFQTQYALNWYGENISTEGKTYGDPQNNFKEVLTIPDFYIDKRQKKLCIYTDGHTYHERTEEQAQRDRNIDRKLQELGFQVLRYTGKDVKENCDKIISDIQKWIY